MLTMLAVPISPLMSLISWVSLLDSLRSLPSFSTSGWHWTSTSLHIRQDSVWGDGIGSSKRGMTWTQKCDMRCNHMQPTSSGGDKVRFGDGDLRAQDHPTLRVVSGSAMSACHVLEQAPSPKAGRNSTSILK